MSDDPYRWCAHCGADCQPDPDDQEHAADCPASTGLWPIEHDPGLELAKWVRWECEADVPEEIKALADQELGRQMVCAECSDPLVDYFMLRDTPRAMTDGSNALLEA